MLKSFFLRLGFVIKKKENYDRDIMKTIMLEESLEKKTRDYDREIAKSIKLEESLEKIFQDYNRLSVQAEKEEQWKNNTKEELLAHIEKFSVALGLKKTDQTNSTEINHYLSDRISSLPLVIGNEEESLDHNLLNFYSVIDCVLEAYLALTTGKNKKIAPLGCKSSRSASISKKKRILVLGWYGAKNAGDELLLKSVLNKLDHNLCNITVLFDEYPNYYWEYWEKYGINFCTWPKEAETSDVISKEFDELIIGGGCHIDDSYGLTKDRFIPTLALSLSKAFIDSNKNVSWLSVSSSRKLTNVEYIKQLGYIIAKAKKFSLRDSFSLMTLKESGIDCKRIILDKDLAFNILKRKKKLLGLTLMKDINNKKIIQEISDICSTNGKYRLILIPFFNGDKNDENYFKKLTADPLFKNIDWEIAPQYENPDQIQFPFYGLDFAINTRFHAALITNFLGIPNIIYINEEHPHYHNKMVALQNSQNRLVYSNQWEKGTLLKLINELNN